MLAEGPAGAGAVCQDETAVRSAHLPTVPFTSDFSVTCDAVWSHFTCRRTSFKLESALPLTEYLTTPPPTIPAEDRWAGSLTPCSLLGPGTHTRLLPTVTVSMVVALPAPLTHPSLSHTGPPRVQPLAGAAAARSPLQLRAGSRVGPTAKLSIWKGHQPSLE